MPMHPRPLSLLLHGPSKAGKTWLADTASGLGPILHLDIEGMTTFTPSRKVYWDPTRETPPTPDGSWDVCVVSVDDFRVLTRAYEWLNSGQHPFVGVTLDSLTEAQKRCIDANFGVESMNQQNWGVLLAQMEKLVRDFRDLRRHPTNPLQFVCITAFTHQGKSNKWEPYVRGQLAVTLPYFIDVVGYLYVAPNEQSGALERRLLVAPHPLYDAGDRTGRLEPYHTLIQPTVPQMIDLIFGPASN